MIKKILILPKILLINVFILEVVCFFLILFQFIPNGLTLMVSAVADRDYSLVHYPDREYQFASECWESNVYYNLDGNRKYSENPNAIKIALLETP